MFYIDKNTAVDDVIEHIIERLNTDYTGCYLYISEFCIDVNNNVDIKMALKVHSTMRTHKVCSDDSESESNPNITITAKGIEIYENGGWKKYIREYEKLKINDQKIQKWGLWGSKSTVLGTFIALASFLWGLFLFMDNKEKEIQIKELKDSLIIEKRAYQLLKVAKDKSSFRDLHPVQKHDSLVHTTK